MMGECVQRWCEGVSSLAPLGWAQFPPALTPAPTHPSTRGKSRIRARARSRRLGALEAAGVAEELGVAGGVGELEVPGVFWALVIGRGGSSSTRSRRRS